MLRKLFWPSALVIAFAAGLAIHPLTARGDADTMKQAQVVDVAAVTSASLDPIVPGVKGKALAQTASGDVAVIEVTGVPKHRHDNTDEMLYVLDGSSVATIGDKDYNVKAGDLIVLPRGTPHQIKGGGTMRLLLISYPKNDPKDMQMMAGTN
jgi:quercetin dioxygenase-like cupin family protein